jgi:hypothetical protein
MPAKKAGQESAGWRMLIQAHPFQIQSLAVVTSASPGPTNQNANAQGALHAYLDVLTGSSFPIWLALALCE